MTYENKYTSFVVQSLHNWYTIHSLYTIQCTTYTVHSALHTVMLRYFTVRRNRNHYRRTLYVVQCAVYVVQCEVYVVQWAGNDVQYAMHDIQCAVYVVQCAVYGDHRTRATRTASLTYMLSGPDRHNSPLTNLDIWTSGITELVTGKVTIAVSGHRCSYTSTTWMNSPEFLRFTFRVIFNI